MSDEKRISILNIHWGFSVGGVSQYAAVIDAVGDHAPIDISTVCIISRKKHVDEQSMYALEGLAVIKRSGPFDLSWIRALQLQIEKTVPDVIITHAFNAHIVAYCIRILLGRKPVFVASYHGEYHPPTAAKRLLEGIYNWFTVYYMKHIATSIISVAECGKRSLVSRGVDAEKITVIHNGIPDVVPDDSERITLRRELGLPDNALVIGVVSRLEPVKGIPYLLHAFQSIVGEFPGAVLLIIGSGAQELYLKKMASELGIDGCVVFTGFRSDASRFFCVLDVFALPSLSEFHSIGLLEAMRASRAIVTTDVGGNTESVSHEREGLIVRPANVDDLVGALRRLLSSKEMRMRLGGGARERYAREFTLDNMIKQSAGLLIRATDDCLSPNK